MVVTRAADLISNLPSGPVDRKERTLGPSYKQHAASRDAGCLHGQHDLLRAKGFRGARGRPRGGCDCSTRGLSSGGVILWWVGSL